MTFQLSSDVDKSKVFLVKRSELNGRIDPNTYHPNRLFAIKQIKGCGFEIGHLGRIAQFKKKIVKSISKADTYVGLENIESNTGCFLATESKTKISSAIVFKKGQVLFPKLRPYLNKVFFANFDGICSTEFHVLDSHVVSNKYLAYFLGLNIVVTQTTFLMSGNTLPRLQTEDIKKILIPIPPKEMQNQIIAKMDAAYFVKKQKEAKSQRLLNDIDDYLLGELGIESPKVEEQNVQNRIFKRKLSVVSGSRLDPYFHKEIFTKDLLEIKKSNFRHGNIMDFFHVTDGTHFTPTYVQKGKKFLSVKNIRPAKIDFEEVRYISDEEHNILIKRAHPQPNDILLTKVGTIGYAAVIPDKCPDFSIFVSVALLKPKSQDINSNYISELLNSSVIKLQFLRSLKGVGVPDLHLENIRKIKIPIPPIEKQIKIAKHIFSIRNQAKQLQHEAITELEQAKKEVEIMIMGDQ